MNISKLSLRTLMPAGWSGKLINWWQAFDYDGTSHPLIGYRNNSAESIALQMQDSGERGFDVVALDCYGQNFKGAGNDFVLDNIAANAGETRQTFLAAIDQQFLTSGVNRFKPSEYQAAMMQYLTHLSTTYFGHPFYERYHGRPLVLFWGFGNSGLSATLDWKAIKAAVPGTPLFIFYQSGGFNVPGSDGAFGWMPVGPVAGNPSGSNYVSNYMLPAIAAHQNMIGISSAWARFNGTQTRSAAWSMGKYLDGAWGMTLLETMGLNNQFAVNHNLPYVLLTTWDDKQEGSDLISGVENDIVVSASIVGTTVQWKVTGHEQTVSAYEIYGAVNDTEVYKLGSVAPDAPKVFDLRGQLLPFGGGPVFVRAVGQPCIANRMVRLG